MTVSLGGADRHFFIYMHMHIRSSGGLLFSLLTTTTCAFHFVGTDWKADVKVGERHHFLFITSGKASVRLKIWFNLKEAQTNLFIISESSTTSPFLSLDWESVTHRDVACLFRTPEHKYPLALWDISAAAPPGLAEKRWRGLLVIIRANPNLVAATCAEQSSAVRKTCHIP